MSSYSLPTGYPFGASLSSGGIRGYSIFGQAGGTGAMGHTGPQGHTGPNWYADDGMAVVTKKVDLAEGLRRFLEGSL